MHSRPIVRGTPDTKLREHTPKKNNEEHPKHYTVMNVTK